MSKINLVIATWSGLRRDQRIQSQDKYFIEDRSTYIRGQIHQLRTLAHNLDQVTIAVPNNPKEPKEFTEFLDSLPPKIKNTQIEIFRRPNGGHSYGSLNSVYEKYTDEFEYYILLEDDYAFVLNHFEKIMIELIEEQNGDLLAQSIVPGPHNIIHAPLGNFICKTSALKLIWDRFGQLPHGPTPDKLWTDKRILGVHKNTRSYSQLAFNYAFVELGLKMTSMKNYFLMPRWGVNSVSWCGFHRSPEFQRRAALEYLPKTQPERTIDPDDVIIVPIQLLIDPNLGKAKHFPKDWPRNWKAWTPHKAA